MSGKKERKIWSVQEKLRIVLAGVQGDIEISELCRREGLSPTQYYGWKKHLAASAGKIFGKEEPCRLEESLEESPEESLEDFRSCLPRNEPRSRSQNASEPRSRSQNATFARSRSASWRSVRKIMFFLQT